MEAVSRPGCSCRRALAQGTVELGLSTHKANPLQNFTATVTKCSLFGIGPEDHGSYQWVIEGGYCWDGLVSSGLLSR